MSSGRSDDNNNNNNLTDSQRREEEHKRQIDAFFAVRRTQIAGSEPNTAPNTEPNSLAGSIDITAAARFIHNNPATQATSSTSTAQPPQQPQVDFMAALVARLNTVATQGGTVTTAADLGESFRLDDSRNAATTTSATTTATTATAAVPVSLANLDDDFVMIGGEAVPAATAIATPATPAATPVTTSVTTIPVVRPLPVPPARPFGSFAAFGSNAVAKPDVGFSFGKVPQALAAVTRSNDDDDNDDVTSGVAIAELDGGLLTPRSSRADEEIVAPKPAIDLKALAMERARREAEKRAEREARTRTETHAVEWHHRLERERHEVVTEETIAAVTTAATATTTSTTTVAAPLPSPALPVNAVRPPMNNDLLAQIRSLRRPDDLVPAPAAPIVPAAAPIVAAPAAAVVPPPPPAPPVPNLAELARIRREREAAARNAAAPQDGAVIEAAQREAAARQAEEAAALIADAEAAFARAAPVAAAIDDALRAAREVAPAPVAVPAAPVVPQRAPSGIIPDPVAERERLNRVAAALAEDLAVAIHQRQQRQQPQQQQPQQQQPQQQAQANAAQLELDRAAAELLAEQELLNGMTAEERRQQQIEFARWSAQARRTREEREAALHGNQRLAEDQLADQEFDDAASNDSGQTNAPAVNAPPVRLVRTSFFQRHKGKIIFAIVGALVVAGAIVLGVMTGGVMPAIAAAVAGSLAVSTTAGFGLGLSGLIAGGLVVGGLMGMAVGAVVDFFRRIPKFIFGGSKGNKPKPTKHSPTRMNEALRGDDVSPELADRLDAVREPRPVASSENTRAQNGSRPGLYQPPRRGYVESETVTQQYVAPPRA